MTSEEIQMHLAAGFHYGREATCGIKRKYLSEQAATYDMNQIKNPRNTLEVYPCFWCSDKDNHIYMWHFGRAMTEEERKQFSD